MDRFPAIQGLRKRIASPTHALQILELSDVVFQTSTQTIPSPLVLEQLQYLTMYYHLAREPMWLLKRTRFEPTLSRQGYPRLGYSLKMIKTLMRKLPLWNLHKLIVFPAASTMASGEFDLTEYNVHALCLLPPAVPQPHAFWHRGHGFRGYG